MKSLSCFCAIVLITFATTTHAQTDFRPGHIVRHGADTAFGLINYREGRAAHKSCTFKTSESDQAVVYLPGEISGYGFRADRHYVTKPMPGSPTTVTFAEILVEGTVSLYRLENSLAIERGNEGLHLLTNETAFSVSNGKRIAKQSNQHIAVLNMLLFDCVELRDRISRIKVSAKAFTKVVQDYNQCNGSKSLVYKSQKPWLQITGGIFGGVNISKIEFRENNPNFDYLNGTFERSISPAGGISLDLTSPRTSERLSLHIDMFYTQSTYYKYSESATSFRRETNSVTIVLKELKIPFGFRYTFPEKRFAPFFNLGAAPTIHVGSNSSWAYEVEANGQFQTSENDALKISKYQLGLWAGVGTLARLSNKLSGFIELRYELTDGVGSLPSDDFPSSFVSEVSNLQAFIGLRTKL